MKVARALRTSAYDVAFTSTAEHGARCSSALRARARGSATAIRLRRAAHHTAPPFPSCGEREPHSAEHTLALSRDGVPSATDRRRVAFDDGSERERRAQGSNLRDLMKARLRPLPRPPPSTRRPGPRRTSAAWSNTCRRASGRSPSPGRARSIVRRARVFERAVRLLHRPFPPELTALAARARLFVGTTAAWRTSRRPSRRRSRRLSARPTSRTWGRGHKRPAEVVREEPFLRPLPRLHLRRFDAPECIRRVPVARVTTPSTGYRKNLVWSL